MSTLISTSCITVKAIIPQCDFWLRYIQTGIRWYIEHRRIGCNYCLSVCGHFRIRLTSATTADQNDCFDMFKTIVGVLRIDAKSYSIAELRVKKCILLVCISSVIVSPYLDKLQEWTDNWQMKFNAMKCYLLSMHGKRDSTLTKYRLKGEAIANTSHPSYLGIELYDDGKWSRHI